MHRRCPKAVIMDVDGTLYHHGRLKRHILLTLLRHLVRHPAQLQDMLAIKDYRSHREHLAVSSYPLRDVEFVAPAYKRGLSSGQLQAIIHHWMTIRPLFQIYKHRLPGVINFMRYLQQQSIATGIFSDYPVTEKLAVMGIVPDVAVHAAMEQVNRLKPHPAGLLHTAQRLNLYPSQCLFIGDKDSKDGECARRAGMDYLIYKGRSRNHSFSSYAQLQARMQSWQ